MSKEQTENEFKGEINPEPIEGEVVISTDVAYQHDDDYSHIAHKKKKRMLKCLEQSLGVVSTASKKAKISRRVHYIWMKEDEDYREAVKEIEELDLDFAESALKQQIKSGSTAATIYYLKCRGGKRGYVETQTLDVTSKGKEVSIAPISFFKTKDGSKDK